MTSQSVLGQRRTVVAAGVRVRRDDGAVLMVRHHAGVAAGRWSVPFIQVLDSETAESAATRLLRDALRLDPGYLQFADTLSIPAADEDVVINVFDANGWAGEPKFSARDFDDAGWLHPSAGADDVVPQVAAWLSGETAYDADAIAALEQLLIDAREGLLDAYAAIPLTARERALDGEWAPVDVLHRAAVQEAYLLDEAVRCADMPGHRWRPFNSEQADAERRVRSRPSDAEVRDRLVESHTATLRVIEALMPEQLAHLATHATRGMLQVRQLIEEIATHDREWTEELRVLRARLPG